MDDVTFRQIENEIGIQKFLKEIETELNDKTYKPSPILRTYIEKANGKLRPLGIATIKDRVTQMSCKLAIEPVFEADFEDEILSPICQEGWYHVNSEQIIIEPVDRNYQPVAPGVMSHTALVTNLSYRTQPIIRYDLGDRLVIRKGQCLCGNRNLAVRVQGRTGEMLSFSNEHGEEVSIPSLAIVTLLNIPGPELVQIRQTSEAAMEIRLLYPDSFDNEIKEDQWKQISKRLEEYLASLGLSHVKFEKSADVPEQSRGGKFKMVIPLAN